MTLHVPRLPLSLHPLMAKAKRRERQRRVIVALVVGVVAAGAALGFELRGLGSVAPVPANLTVLAVAEDSGALGPQGGGALFHLRDNHAPAISREALCAGPTRP
jgi:hypothetical protein